MKRHRILRLQFDTRAKLLSEEIKKDWEPEVQEQWRQNKKSIKEGLMFEFGESAFDKKVQNLIDLGSMPLSIQAFHNRFLSECRNSFIIDSFYPSLTGASALGERILNHLVLVLREDFQHTAEYKKVFRKSSFDNWKVAIDVLAAWEILLPDVIEHYLELMHIRNNSLHFRLEIEHNIRESALQAITLLQKIIDRQFGAFGSQPWFIRGIPGEAYIAKEWESNSFVKRIYLPNCELVGPYHRLEYQRNPSRFLVHDSFEYSYDAISDSDFARLRNQGRTQTN